MKALDTFFDRAVRGLGRSNSVQSERRGDLCSAVAPRARGWADYPSSYDHGFSRTHAEHSALRLGRLRFNGNLHTRAGCDRGCALDGYRALAHRVLAGGPTLLSGRGSRLVLSASGSAEIRTVPNARLARGAAFGDWDRGPEYHAGSGRSAGLVRLKTNLRPGVGERISYPVATGQ